VIIMTEQEYREEYDRIQKEYPIIEKYIPVADNWKPNYPDDEIRATIMIVLNTECVHSEKPRFHKYHIFFDFYNAEFKKLFKTYSSDDFSKIVQKYEEWQDYLNKIPFNIELKKYLLKDNFEWE